MDMKLAQPYFYLMLQSVQRVTEIFLVKVSKLEPYKTTDGTYARIHTGVFNRLNEFWLWVITVLVEKDLRRINSDGLNSCAQVITELLQTNCDDLEKWMYAEREAEIVWNIAVPGNTINFGLIIQSLEKLGNMEMANEARQAQTIALIVTLFRHLAIAYRLAIQYAKINNLSRQGQVTSFGHTARHALEAASALLYLSAPDSLMLDGSTLDEDRTLTISDIAVITTMTSCGTIILDKLCELQLLRRLP